MNSQPRSITSRYPRLIFFAVILPFAPILAGCPGLETGNEIVDGNTDQTLQSPLGKTFGEPNDTFDDPIVAMFARNEARLQGNVAREHDFDVYLIEELEAGQRIVIDATAFNSMLDVSIALFDSQGRLAFENDDRLIEPGAALDAYIDFIIRRQSAPYYLVVTHSAFAAPQSRGGEYAVAINLAQRVETPDPLPQTLFLDFDGASVDSRTLGRFQLPPFDSADIAPAYDRQTDLIKETIIETMRQNYAPFNVEIVSSDDSSGGTEGASTLFFGSFNRGAFGLAEQVDLYNSDHCDDAIIFTETFSPSAFIGTPTARELGIAVGNVAAHEAGHLLGLNHTNDDRDLMDDQSPADVFLQDQEFMQAPLSSDIMQIGTQDGVLLLAETVGLSGERSSRKVPISFFQQPARSYSKFAGIRRKMQAASLKGGSGVFRD